MHLLLRLLCLALFGVASVASLLAADYHLDCTGGNDTNSGLTPSAAWRSVSRASNQVLEPGDRLLLRRGTVCLGMLHPKGTGTAGNPATVGAYGEGPLPVVDGGNAEAAIRLVNQQYWHLENLETKGGTTYGVLITGDRGVLRHFRLTNLVVHDVHGSLKSKQSGLVMVIAGSAGQTFEDVVIDGVTAYGTTQWSGIQVRGSSSPDGSVRGRNITVRNSIVHHVYGDGIVLFQVQDGLIERSAAWLTGLQPVETIGTPSAIWTWRCTRCIVQQTEGYFSDSPGVDGGVYDIDWGNEQNIVQDNYGHDSMGFCASVFAAGNGVTTESVVRNNVCVGNGRSPKLAKRQGDLFIATWDGGKLDGVDIYNNTFFWNPSIDTPLVRMNNAEFTGSRPNRVHHNVFLSTVPSLLHAATPLEFDHNHYWFAGQRSAVWEYPMRSEGMDAFRAATGQEMQGSYGDPRAETRIDENIGAILWAGTTRDRSSRAGVSAARHLVERFPERAASRIAPAGRVVVEQLAGHWGLLLLAGEGDSESRSLLVFLKSALNQYQDRGLKAAIYAAPGESNLRYNWNLGEIPLLDALPAGAGAAPHLLLISPNGNVHRTWKGVGHPADLGLTLRKILGPPPGAAPAELPRN